MCVRVCVCVCVRVCVRARGCVRACNANKLRLFGGVFIPESPRTSVNTLERAPCVAHLAGHSVAHARSACITTVHVQRTRYGPHIR